LLHAAAVLLCMGYKVGELSNDGALSLEYAHEFYFGSTFVTFVMATVVLSGVGLVLVLCTREVRLIWL
jgi:hypothetical protein